MKAWVESRGYSPPEKSFAGTHSIIDLQLFLKRNMYGEKKYLQSGSLNMNMRRMICPNF